MVAPGAFRLIPPDLALLILVHGSVSRHAGQQRLPVLVLRLILLDLLSPIVIIVVVMMVMAGSRSGPSPASVRRAKRRPGLTGQLLGQTGAKHTANKSRKGAWRFAVMMAVTVPANAVMLVMGAPVSVVTVIVFVAVVAVVVVEFRSIWVVRAAVGGGVVEVVGGGVVEVVVDGNRPAAAVSVKPVLVEPSGGRPVEDGRVTTDGPGPVITDGPGPGLVVGVVEATVDKILVFGGAAVELVPDGPGETPPAVSRFRVALGPSVEVVGGGDAFNIL